MNACPRQAAVCDGAGAQAVNGGKLLPKAGGQSSRAIAVHHWILEIIFSSSWEAHFQAGHPDNEEGDEAQAQQQYHEDCDRLAARA